MMQHRDYACLGTDGALTAAERDAMNQRYEKLLADFERCTAELERCTAELATLKAMLSTPEIEDFDKAVPLEAAHQMQRWAGHDADKSPEDWFWLCGYLAGKALAAYKVGDYAKAKHHCISTSAAMRNWHAHIQNERGPDNSEELARFREEF